LDLRARLVVEGFLTGQHRSPYHGFAIEFAGHREYVPGDDVKHVDWKVWSKTDRMYIKEYEEETNLNCTILVDCSKSMKYGSETPGSWSKFDYAATAAASLAYLLQRQQDAVGLVLFNTRVQCNLPHRAHPNHWNVLVHELEQTEPDDQTDVADIFPVLARQIPQRGMVVLLSDLFVDLETLNATLRQFRLRRHEVAVFHVMHEQELNVPFQDSMEFRGLEMDRQLVADPRALRRSYLDAVERFLEQTRRMCAGAGIDYVLMSTADPLDAVLSRYLLFRQRVGSRIPR
jgi:uncharacterized protein (DUF58 family)